MNKDSAITTEKVLCRLLEGLCMLVSSRCNYYRWSYDKMYPGYLDDFYSGRNKALNHRINRYKNQGWVIVSRSEGKRWLTLSDKGRKMLAGERLKNIKFPPPEKWTITRG